MLWTATGQAVLNFKRIKPLKQPNKCKSNKSVNTVYFYKHYYFLNLLKILPILNKVVCNYI